MYGKDKLLSGPEGFAGKLLERTFLDLMYYTKRKMKKQILETQLFIYSCDFDMFSWGIGSDPSSLRYMLRRRGLL